MRISDRDVAFAVMMALGLMAATALAQDSPERISRIDKTTLVTEADAQPAIVRADDAVVAATAEAEGAQQTCQTVGQFVSLASGQNRFRGNAFHVGNFDDVVLRRFSMKLRFTGNVALHFSVHKAPAGIENQVFEPVANPQPVAASGNNTQQLYASPTLNLQLEANTDYILGVAWTQTDNPNLAGRDVTYGNNGFGANLPDFLHGEVLGIVVRNAVTPPLADSLENVGISPDFGAYEMELCFDPVPGACCDSGAGRCVSVLRSACTAEGSFFSGDRTLCAETVCRFGACCDACGGCADNVATTLCEMEHGVPHVGATCPAEGDPRLETLCPPTLGACCDGAGGCTEVCEAECTGTYLGDGTTCEPNFCRGACCVPGGCTNVRQGRCVDLGGEFKGDGTTCATLPPELECGGACCFGFKDTLDSCTQVSERAACTTEVFEQAVYVGDMRDCPVDDPDTKTVDEGCNGLVVGACCLPDGTCINTTSTFCGRSWVDGEFNSGVECPAAGEPSICQTGACCFSDGTCHDLTERACTDEDRGGQFASGISCTELTDDCRSAIPQGACCGVEAGVCTPDQTEAECDEAGGIFIGSICVGGGNQGLSCADATDCPDGTCDSAILCSGGSVTCPGFGACCRETGECFDDVASDDCGPVFNGEYQGDGSLCEDVIDACDMRGACCTDTGGCLFVTADECFALTDSLDTFAGDGVTCAQAGCRAGACCLSDGVCEVRRVDLCDPTEIDPEVTYLGDGTQCETGLCVKGACCAGDDSCQFVLESECESPNVFTRGVDCADADTCVDNACCNNGSCNIQTLAECLASGGVYQRNEPVCLAGLCTLGSCCTRDGRCIDDLVLSECQPPDAIEFRPGVFCSPEDPCDQIGACCRRDGTCVDDLSTTECEAGENGRLFANSTCADIADVCTPVGACCLASGCVPDMSEADCTDQGGIYQGDLSVCESGTCTIGSCCTATGECVDDLVPSQCDELGGRHRPGVTCAAGPLCSGACCLSDGTCADGVVEASCAAVAGVFTAEATCEDVTCVPLGGCCVDGTCTTTTESDCSDQQGFYLGDDTVCTGDECALGGCCQLDGTCVDDIIAPLCEGPQVRFEPGLACESFCIARGACCVGDTCEDNRTAVQCANLGGAYNGDGTVCDAGTCTTGACCFDEDPDPVCEDGQVRAACGAAGGSFAGPDSTCVAGLCAFGSCCNVDGTCTDSVIERECASPGIFRAGVTCGEEVCEARGSCCLDGTCQLLTRTECLGLGGIFGTAGSLCEPDDVCAVGACCLFDGGCANGRTRRNCEAGSGVFLGEGSTCSDPGVACARGTCCESDGTCTDDVIASQCGDPGDQFTAGAACDEIECEPRGACCRGPACTIEIRATCLLVGGGEYQGVATVCEPSPCPELGIDSAEPGDCSIDPAQPSEPDGTGVFGVTIVTLFFNGDVPVLLPADFAVTTNPGNIAPPAVVAVNAGATSDSLVVDFDGPIPPGEWTCIEHTASATQICLGYLPADVNADGLAEAADLAALLDCLTGAASCPVPSCDIDRSGTCAPADLLRAIDLLNGGDAYMIWESATLPACP